MVRCRPALPTAAAVVARDAAAVDKAAGPVTGVINTACGTGLSTRR